ncbi:MAG: deoxyribodipyrimidine photo-lyase [Clostridiales bacterium]|nr:deoxyribodipyrimidine photo-lyase [Clostridiales bacterium]
MKALYLIRKDIRVEDNSAIRYLIENDLETYFLYVDDIRDPIQASRGKTVRMALLSKMNQSLGGSIRYEKGRSEEILNKIIIENGIDILIYQRQYEPWEVEIEKEIKNIDIEQVVVDEYLMLPPEKGLKDDGTMYRVFRPYFEKWLKRLNVSFDVNYDISNLKSINPEKWKLAENYGKIEFTYLDEFFNNRLQKYEEFSDFPNLDNTSKVSKFLNNGGISVKEIFNKGHESEAFIRQLAWRDYYYHWMFFYPKSLKENHNRIYFQWNDSEDDFNKWKQGKTGFKIVDAAMTQLKEEGWINGRLRMIAASFLVKDLHIDWRKGERYFYEQLIDADKALNVGNWQWIAGTGILSQPYFRVMNPVTQLEKFDKNEEYSKQFIKEIVDEMVDHKLQRKIFIEHFKKGLT